MSPFALISHLLWLISFEIKMGGQIFSIAASASLWGLPWGGKNHVIYWFLGVQWWRFKKCHFFSKGTLPPPPTFCCPWMDVWRYAWNDLLNLVWCHLLWLYSRNKYWNQWPVAGENEARPITCFVVDLRQKLILHLSIFII